MRFNPKAVLALQLLCVGVICAQTGARSGGFGDRQGAIRGSVVLADGTPPPAPLKVMLRVMRGEVTFTLTDQQGRFELNNVAAGQYTIEVDVASERKYEPATETVQVARGGGTAFVTIFLKEKKPDPKTGGDKTISVAMLDQKVPAAAKREFQSATKLASEGNANGAIEALKRAIAIYPDYLMAHNDLGAQLLDLGQYDAAAAELQVALKIDPKAFNPQLNLGIVQIRKNSFPEALATLDKALSIEPAAPAAHLYAGIASAKLGDLARGEKELKAAYDLGGTDYAVALLQLGRLYMKRGEREMARKSFESYLRESPNAADAAQVQKLLGTLQ